MHHSKKARLQFTTTLQKIFFVVLAACVLLLLVTHSINNKKTFTSAEVYFADASPSGMKIIPASCPSNPGDDDAPYGCSGDIPLCPDGTPAPYFDSGSGPVPNLNMCPAPTDPPCSLILDFFGLCPTSYALAISQIVLSPGEGVTVHPGDTITYRLYFRNTGSGAQTNMSINNGIPDNTHYEWQGGGTDTNSNGQQGGGIWWLNYVLPAAGNSGDSGYVDFSMTVNAGAPDGQICNSGEIHSDQVASIYSNTVCNPLAASDVPVVPDIYPWGPWGPGLNGEPNFNDTQGITFGFTAASHNSTFPSAFPNVFIIDGSVFSVENVGPTLSLYDVASNSYYASMNAYVGTLSAGSHTIRVCVDKDSSLTGVIDENDEGNNCSPTIPFQVDPNPYQPSTCPYAGQVCYSAPNICNETNTGVYGSDPSCPCSATTPPDTMCNPPIVVNTWNVRPTLVRAGDLVYVEWDVSNAAGCSVVSTKGDNWSGLSGSKSTSVFVQTIFTLHCSALPNVVPDSVTQSVTVNIIPGFIEK